MDDNPLFERSVSRHELLKKVAVYTPPLVLGGRALISAGVASAAGETSTSIPASSATSSTSLWPDNPLLSLQSDLATLLGVTATGVRNVDKKIAEAVGDLSEATLTAQWADDYTLTAASGDVVFFDLIWAADALNTSGSSNSNVAEVLADIVTQAGWIANIAVSDAGLTGKTATKAARKLAKGAKRAANGQVRGAIAAYMHAWDIAVTGTEAPTPDDSDSDD